MLQVRTRGDWGLLFVLSLIPNNKSSFISFREVLVSFFCLHNKIEELK